jgi:hypothetical protein
MMTPTKKRNAHLEIAMLLAEKGLDAIPDTKTLLQQKLVQVGTLTTFKKLYSNWGGMISTLKKVHPDLMNIATQKNIPAPKAKPAVKPAVKKGKVNGKDI